MINLDNYITNYETRYEEIQNSLIQTKTQKKQKIRITRLSEEKRFVPVEVQLNKHSKNTIHTYTKKKKARNRPW